MSRFVVTGHYSWHQRQSGKERITQRIISASGMSCHEHLVRCCSLAMRAWLGCVREKRGVPQNISIVGIIRAISMCRFLFPLIIIEIMAGCPCNIAPIDSDNCMQPARPHYTFFLWLMRAWWRYGNSGQTSKICNSPTSAIIALIRIPDAEVKALTISHIENVLKEEAPRIHLDEYPKICNSPTSAIIALIRIPDVEVKALTISHIENVLKEEAPRGEYQSIR